MRPSVATHISFILCHLIICCYSSSLTAEQQPARPSLTPQTILQNNGSDPTATSTTEPAITQTLADKTPKNLTISEYNVIKRVKHDRGNFTQGLFFIEDDLYESTGNYGESRIIKYQGIADKIIKTQFLNPNIFGEGSTELNGRIYMLTWRSQRMLEIDPSNLTLLNTYAYQGEGWGLTNDGEHLWMSNGSSRIAKINTQGDVISFIDVSLQGEALDQLNELEWIYGMLVANRWFDNHIYFIDPSTGKVIAQLDLSGLAMTELIANENHVLNGIAWLETEKQLWVTGKNWAWLYQIDIPWLLALEKTNSAPR